MNLTAYRVWRSRLHWMRVQTMQIFGLPNEQTAYVWKHSENEYTWTIRETFDGTLSDVLDASNMARALANITAPPS